MGWKLFSLDQEGNPHTHCCRHIAAMVTITWTRNCILTEKTPSPPCLQGDFWLSSIIHSLLHRFCLLGRSRVAWVIPVTRKRVKMVLESPLIGLKVKTDLAWECVGQFLVFTLIGFSFIWLAKKLCHPDGWSPRVWRAADPGLKLGLSSRPHMTLCWASCKVHATYFLS